MRVLSSLLVVSTLAVAACGSDSQRDALYQDELDREIAIALAEYRDAETRELNDAAIPEPEPEAAPAAVAPRPARQQTAPRASAPQPQRQPQPRVVTETNVKRDAAIGAGVGAVAGAVIHKPNRVKGAVVGAVLGGAAGAVVGATIDKKTTVVYH